MPSLGFGDDEPCCGTTPTWTISAIKRCCKPVAEELVQHEFCDALERNGEFVGDSLFGRVESLQNRHIFEIAPS
jgi:hypothetical protein